MDQEQGRALSTGQVAKYCGVHFRTVNRWIKANRLEGYKLPGRGDYRIKVESFIAFLQANDMPIPEEFQNEVGGEEEEGLSSKRAMIVEDHTDIAQLIKLLLNASGIKEIVIAEDGFIAGTLLAEFKPHVIFLDINMPRLDGIAVLTYIKGHKKYKTTKVVIVSGEQQSRLDEARIIGADQIITKPIDKARFMQLVQHHFK